MAKVAVAFGAGLISLGGCAGLYPTVGIHFGVMVLETTLTAYFFWIYLNTEVVAPPFGCRFFIVLRFYIPFICGAAAAAKPAFANDCLHRIRFAVHCREV